MIYVEKVESNITGDLIDFFNSLRIEDVYRVCDTLGDTIIINNGSITNVLTRDI